MPVFRRYIYGCQSGSVLYRRKPARIAVGQNTVAVLEKPSTVFTDFTAHLNIFVMQLQSLFLECRPYGVRALALM